MIFLLSFAVGITIWLQYDTRRELRRDRQKAAKLNELRERACSSVYDGWIQSTYFEYMKKVAKDHGLDYIELVNTMPKLAELKPEDIQIAPWDTPHDFVRRGRAGEIVFQSHPDFEDVKAAINKFRDAEGS